MRLPWVKALLAERDATLAKCDAMLAERDATFQRLRRIPLNETRLLYTPSPFDSIDDMPWNHPYLSIRNITRFRDYSNAANSFAHEYMGTDLRQHLFSCAFVINMAQNMYKWAKLAQKYGVRCELFLNPHDETALSDPRWEEFDGEFSDLPDAKGFRKVYRGSIPAVPCHVVPMDGEGMWDNLNQFSSGNRKPLLRQLASSPGMRHEPLMAYQGVYPYFALAQRLSKFDVIYSASNSIAAYTSGKPYCYFAVGGDFQWDCGRSDSYGEIMSLAVNAARFLMISNPHALGHSRRLGFRNGVYLPYPMDSQRYSPGQGTFRQEWKNRFGGRVHILTTSRLDSKVKGFGDDFFQMIMEAARQRPEVRFIFIAWGTGAAEFKKKITENCMDRQLIVLMPVGKARLIEYYRSCDIVLDQLVYGYLGATALEAASVGKPVIMKLRTEQYEPLYGGDLPPVTNVQTPHELKSALLSLIDHPERRIERGQGMRSWLVRNHGEEVTIPRLLALLRLTADGVALPAEIAAMNPLLDDETAEELDYHRSCLRKVVHDRN